MTAPIQVHAVAKSFNGKRVLDDITFEIHRGEVFGLLGPNGAGKTTLLRILLDLIRPDSGEVRVFGARLGRDDRGRIGYLPEERGLYPRQPVRAVLEYLGRLHGLSARAAGASADRWLERFDLGSIAGQRVEQLSKGNQQKVQVAATMLGSPAIVILDEPFSGLDPVNVRLVMNVVSELARSGTAILLSAHQMSLVEHACTRVLMIAEGRSVLYGDLATIRRQNADDCVVVSGEIDWNIRRGPLVADVAPVRGGVRVKLQDGVSAQEYLEWLVRSGARIDRFETAHVPLEDIFLRYAAAAAAGGTTDAG
ncbi:MAG: ATP-binding cassette domain-containing protein [Acidobacteria bacterium]|nr:ATP-binding cassette domain-containing protein [Acidobacteriota bacterium]